MYYRNYHRYNDDRYWQAPSYGSRYYPRYPRHHHFFIKLIILAVVVIFGITALGYFENQHVHTPEPASRRAGQAPQRSQSRPSGLDRSPRNASADKINLVWSHIESDLQSGSGNLLDDDSVPKAFVNGSSNTSFLGINDWYKEVARANYHNHTRVNSIRPLAIRVRGDQIAFKVRYNFRVHFSDGVRNHIQVFNWRAKVNGRTGKIILMNSPHTPAEDYQE